MPPTLNAKRKCFHALITNLCTCFRIHSAFMLPYCKYACLFHAFFMLFYKYIASRNFPLKSVMLRVTSSLQSNCHFAQHGTSPGNVFVHVASSVGNLKFLDVNLLFPSAWVKNPKRSPETSVRIYHYSLRSNPDERSSHLPRGGSLKSSFKFRLPMHSNLTLSSSTVLKCQSSPSKFCKYVSTRDKTLVFKTSQFLFENCPVNSSQRGGLPCTVSSSVSSPSIGVGNNLA
jgi:hypothetical protein